MPEAEFQSARTESTAPSVFAISAVFGGSLGMLAASAFGVDAGGGFIVGAVLTFMFLSVMVLMARVIERTASIDRIVEMILPDLAAAASDGSSVERTTDIARALRQLSDRDR